jgi:hypothetical protein
MPILAPETPTRPATRRARTDYARSLLGRACLIAACTLLLLLATSDRARAQDAPSGAAAVSGVGAAREGIPGAERRRPRIVQPSRLARLGYYSLSEAPNVYVSRPEFAWRLSSMAERSALVRARLADIRDSRMPVYVVTPERAREVWPDFRHDLRRSGFYLAAAYVPRSRWSGRIERAMVILDLDALDGAYEHAGAPPHEREDDLDALLGHELISHVGSIAKSRDLADMCEDPPPREILLNGGGAACALQEDNRIRGELGSRLPERTDYFGAGLHAERYLAEKKAKGGAAAAEADPPLGTQGRRHAVTDGSRALAGWGQIETRGASWCPALRRPASGATRAGTHRATSRRGPVLPAC